jgi:hypothetical protein
MDSFLAYLVSGDSLLVSEPSLYVFFFFYLHACTSASYVQQHIWLYSLYQTVR